MSRWERQAYAVPSVHLGALPPTTYEAMERDSMIQTTLSVKRLGVLAAPWTIEPADGSLEARKRASFVEEALARMDGSANQILDQAMDAFAKGWSVQEALYEESDGHLWLRSVRPKNPAYFGIEIDAFGEIKMLNLEIPGEVRTQLDRNRFVLYAHRSSYSRPKGRSDLEAAYPHWVQKTALLEAWRLHLHRFGSPTMLARFERTASSTEQEQMLRGLSDLAQNSAMVFPNDFDVQALSAGQGPSQGFLDAIEFHNREIARSILGQTLTTDEGRRVGSLALGKVHLQVLLLQLQSIRDELADRVMTEQVIGPLSELNFGAGLLPRFRFSVPPLTAFQTGEVG